MPSCTSSAAIVTSIRKLSGLRHQRQCVDVATSVVNARSFDENPLAVVDLDHRACAIVEAIVLGGRHRVYAVRGDQLLRILERVTQCSAEFLRPGLSLL